MWIKKTEKILKYKDLEIEIQRMWNVKTKVIPVIIGANGTISKSFRKYVSNIPGKHEVKELQKTAILGTAHILRKVLMWKYNRFNTETIHIITMNSNNRIAATLYSLGRNISINTLHRGDGDDDDDDDDNNNYDNNFNHFYAEYVHLHIWNKNMFLG